MPYQLEDITLQERVKLSCQLVAHQGEYGLVTRLAREHGVSRQLLYELRDRTRAAAEAELAPRPPGRKPVDKRAQVDEIAVASTSPLSFCWLGSPGFARGLCYRGRQWT